jgi:hypothetical protein
MSVSLIVTGFFCLAAAAEAAVAADAAAEAAVAAAEAVVAAVEASVAAVAAVEAAVAAVAAVEAAVAAAEAAEAAATATKMAEPSLTILHMPETDDSVVGEGSFHGLPSPQARHKQCAMQRSQYDHLIPEQLLWNFRPSVRAIRRFNLFLGPPKSRMMSPWHLAASSSSCRSFSRRARYSGVERRMAHSCSLLAISCSVDAMVYHRCGSCCCSGGVMRAR